MLPALTIVGGLLLIIGESVALRLFGVLVWAPQIAVVTVAYVSLRRSFSQAAAATLIFAAVADVCWGGPRGYYALGLTAVFFLGAGVRSAAGRLGTIQVALLVIPATIVTDVVALLTLALFQRGASPISALLTVSPLVAALTGLVALPMVWVMSWIDRAIERRRTEGLARS